MIYPLAMCVLWQSLRQNMRRVKAIPAVATRMKLVVVRKKIRPSCDLETLATRMATSVPALLHVLLL